MSSKAFLKISVSLKSEVLDSSNSDLSLERCQDLVGAIEQENGSKRMTVAILQKTSIGVTLGKAIKAFRRRKRSSGEDAAGWDALIGRSQRLVTTWKTAAAKENSSSKASLSSADEEEGDSIKEGLPKTKAVYKSRLTQQRKELYKDPPELPPPAVIVEEKNCCLPKRDKKTGALTFVCGNSKDIQPILKDFHPNRTPEEIMRAGSFGGTYFRPIVSAVTNLKYVPSQVLQDTVNSKWIEGLDKKTMLTSSTYKPTVNKFGVKCGGSLGMWESSGWITDADPYGWFQWYCRFYQGRRCSDDARQISRWAKSAGSKGRFRSQLCNKILNANTSHSDTKISPVIRQTLLHWGIEITPSILEQHRKRTR
uniref:Uncharacterized protein n=1 Tax=Asterionellopsis glacialis TaxID=33640 RepID=A0A7S0L193_9STRA|mmetsp:Transcript_649/g.967  ORF Transcript_649/g.967 Transcript_649/m.967 type:complete len:366 (+) Transcript_649:83-1180(+)